jgi:5-methylcytosine-specific restriction endonuclease McrA
MSQKKKAQRAAFREAVFTRDKHRCKVCGASEGPLDAHHITPREEMPGGGYIAENGITLCAECHVGAEDYLQGRRREPRFAPETLRILIHAP